MPGILDLLSQTWPVRMGQGILGALTLPRDAYLGRVDPLSDEGIGRAADLAGLVMGGTFAKAPAGALGAGPVRRARSLPMGAGAPMERAKDMGFYTNMPLYHGTDREFKAFDLARSGSTTGVAPARMGVWATRDPEIANEFATMAHEKTGGAPQVYPLLHRASSPVSVRLEGNEMNHEIAATLDHFWSQGHDSVMLRNYTSPAGKTGDILVVRDPAQLRSPYAKFDPAKRNSAELLAGIGGGAVLAPYLFGSAQSQTDEQ